MKRPLALSAAAVLVAAWSVWPQAGAAPVVLRADATAAPLHAFYDHEGLAPVPLFNLSVSFTKARYEPGPSTEALGSFLWEPEAADLQTIFCVLSEGQFCQFPDYPIVARASHPAGSDEGSPPVVAIEDEAAPVSVRAAHERAEAGPKGSRAEADVARFAAIPMSPPAARVTRSLATTLGAEAEQEWLVLIEEAVSRSTTRVRAGTIEASARSRITGLELLGGLLRIEKVAGRVTATAGDGPSGTGEAVLSGVRVADLEARIGPRGVRITDAAVGESEAETLSEAVNAALAEIGLEIGAGRERVRKGGGGAEAEAFAFSLDFRRRLLPEQFPEGTQGADVVRLPLGLARAEAGTATLPDLDLGPPVSEGATEAPPVAAGAGAPVGGGGGGPPDGPDGLEPPPEPAPEPGAAAEVAAAPVTAIESLGIPAWAVVAAVAGAIALALGLVWLRVQEVLIE